MIRINLFHFKSFVLTVLFLGVLINPLKAVQTSPPSPNLHSISNPFEEPASPPVEEGDRFIAEFIHMLAVLGLFIGFLIVVAWFLKRMLNTRMEQINTKSPIKILERRSLSPRTTIYILNIQGLQVAIAESHTGVTLLGPVEDEEEESDSDNKENFNRIKN